MSSDLGRATVSARRPRPTCCSTPHNPVHWRPWGAEALAEAKRRDCPILLSIGYAACHWCHVMAHESFENAEIASLMNALFVNVKVDREERPDIDHIYMTALHALGQQGGWPLTMFLDPEGKPMFGGTYWPPEPRWGRPAFRQILESVDAAWRTRRPAMEERGRTLTAHLAELSAPSRRPQPHPRRPDPGRRRRFSRAVDPAHGGIGGAPEIPQRADLPLLLERDVPPPRPEVRRGRPRAARRDQRGRHLRPSRRRLRPLFDRRRMARAAFREDALRQRADSRIAGAGPAAVARPALWPSGRARRSAG